MPVYEYECERCGKLHLKQKKIDERDNGPTCCGEQTKLVPSIPAFRRDHIEQ